MTDAAATILAAAIADCLEPLAQIAEQAHDFDQAFDETHLRLMKLLSTQMDSETVERD